MTRRGPSLHATGSFVIVVSVQKKKKEKKREKGGKGKEEKKRETFSLRVAVVVHFQVRVAFLFPVVDDWKFRKLASFGVTNCNFKNYPRALKKKSTRVSVCTSFSRESVRCTWEWVFFLSFFRFYVKLVYHHIFINVNYNSWMWIEFFFNGFLRDSSIFIRYRLIFKKKKIPRKLFSKSWNR